jgi:mediator of RNA polymerase II transcription subunit 14
LLDAFWSNLTLFATGMIAQAVDMRELHRHRIKSRSNDCANLGLPQQVRLPAIEVDLSVMFPHMVFETAPKPKHDAGGAAKDAEVLALMHPHTGGPQGPRQPWANNIVTIRFKGVQSQFNDGQYRLVCVSEALLKVRRQAKFTTLKGSVDRNLSYDGKKGEFSLRMEHAVGEPVLAVLKSRIMAIDRFVNFLEAIEKYKAFITPESVTLKQVTFFYQDKHAEPKDGSEAIRWKVMLDLSKDEIDIDIEKGNPHLRVVDLMKRLVNSEGGIPALMGWLPASLQALEAINKMETRWEDAQSKRTGQVEFAMKTLSWLSIRYWMHNPTPTKEVVLEVRTKIRRGEAWWHVWRSDAGASTTPEDEFTTALKTIWNGKGDGWLGLTTGAAARSDSGIVDMLLAVDEAIRTAGNGASKSTQSASAAPPVAQNNAHDVVVLD